MPPVSPRIPAGEAEEMAVMKVPAGEAEEMAA